MNVPLAKRIVLKWNPNTDSKMAQDYKWYCPYCNKVYERQTDAQLCCMERKEKPYWFKEGMQPKHDPVGVRRGKVFTSFKELFDTWLDFATRMVDHVFDRTPERKAKVREKVVDYIERFRGFPLAGWDHEHSDTGMYMCDHFDYWFDEYYNDRQEKPRFLTDIACAIRAGLDIAYPEQVSGGVVGFTVGDLRKMYPEGIPDYVTNFFHQSLPPDAKDEEHVWL